MLDRARLVAGPSFRHLVVTAGAQPVTVLSGGAAERMPVPRLPPRTDTTGAGDFFAAGLLDGLARGMPAARAAAYGAATAARVLSDRRAFLDDRIDRDQC